MNSRHTVAIALGSNLGDRDAHLDFALDRLARLLPGLRCSSRHQTVPVDVPDDQPMFLNAAVVGQTSLAPADLFLELQRVEQERGRDRPYRNASRTLDLDIILFGEQIVETPQLVIPHPRFRDRRFVLAPLAEIAPDLRDPVSGLTVAVLLARISLPGAPDVPSHGV